jgi:hypothetical protein
LVLFAGGLIKLTLVLLDVVFTDFNIVCSQLCFTDVESSMKQCTAMTTTVLSIVVTFALIIIAGLFSAVIFFWKQASKYRNRFTHQHLTRVNTGMTITTNLSRECNHLNANNEGDIIAGW